MVERKLFGLGAGIGLLVLSGLTLLWLVR